jgi:hypothetical protein
LLLRDWLIVNRVPQRLVNTVPTKGQTGRSCIRETKTTSSFALVT